MSQSEHVLLAEMLKQRTKLFGIIKMYRTLPKTTEAQIISRQLLRSSTSLAANYRAACRARSKAEFTAKMCIVVEETDETVFWIELLVETNIIPLKSIKGLNAEINELLAIFSTVRRTAKGKRQALLVDCVWFFQSDNQTINKSMTLYVQPPSAHASGCFL